MIFRDGPPWRLEMGVAASLEIDFDQLSNKVRGLHRCSIESYSHKPESEQQ